MEHLTTRDLRALSDFLAGNYQLQSFPGFVQHLLSALPNLVPVELIGYHEMHPQEAKSENWWSPDGIASASLDRAWERHMDEHPVLTHYVRTRDGKARKISDFYSTPQFHDYGLYREFYRPMGVEDVLCYALPFKPPRVIGIALHRERRNFKPRDSSVLNLLRPHLAQGWLNARLYERLQKDKEAYCSVADHAGVGAVGLGPGGRIQTITPAAERWLDLYFGPRRDAGALPPELREWLRQQSLRTDLAARTPMVMENMHGRLVIRTTSHDNRTVLLLAEKRHIDRSRLAALGLTESEFNVIYWVARGKTNAEIATILGISWRTAQKHLENIFRKLKVETRTAAIAMVMDNRGSA